MKILFSVLICIIGICSNTMAQSNSQYVRIAKLVIDSSKLHEYKMALKEHAEAAVKLEPGVIMLYAVYENDHPTNVSVFEIYATKEAYLLHIKAPHFLKYKSAVEHMVKSLQLEDVTPIVLEAKLKMVN